MSEQTNANASRWCIVANVVDERPFGPGAVETKSGTQHFRAGAKVYVFALYPGMCESVVVVGHHRGSNRYATMVVKAAYLTNFRAAVAYSPTVLRLISEFGAGADGAIVISDAEGVASDWAKTLPFWRPPFHGRSPDSEVNGAEER